MTCRQVGCVVNSFIYITCFSYWRPNLHNGLFDVGRSGGIFNRGRSRVWFCMNDESWVTAIQVESRLINGCHLMGLDSIRFETHDPSPTLSLIRLVIVRKSSRRGILIIFKEIGAEIGRFQTVGGQVDSHLGHSGRFPINSIRLFRFRSCVFRTQSLTRHHKW